MLLSPPLSPMAAALATLFPKGSDSSVLHARLTLLINRRCDDQHMVLVSVTRLHLRTFRYFPLFLIYNLAAVRQIRRADGFLRGALAGDSGRGFWTVTLWRDEGATRLSQLGCAPEGHAEAVALVRRSLVRPLDTGGGDVAFRRGGTRPVAVLRPAVEGAPSVRASGGRADGRRTRARTYARGDLAPEGNAIAEGANVPG